MSKIVTIEEMRQIEAAADASLLSYERMMDNAGRAAADYLRSRIDITDRHKITFLIGKGNNGGDGLVAARALAEETDARIRLYLLGGRPDTDRNVAAAQAAEIFIAHADHDHDHRLLRSLIASSDVIVDALFGIGLRLPLRGKTAQLLRIARNEITRRSVDPDRQAAESLTSASLAPKATEPFVLTIDCPSGIDCDSGEADPVALPADATITFIAVKPGLLTFPAAKHVGDLVVSAIGITADFPPLQASRRSLIDLPAAKSLLPPRPLDGHKGSFGKVLTIGGSANYVGAIALAAESAYRAGAGLSAIATTSTNIGVVAGQLREATYLPLRESDGYIAASNSAEVAEAAQRYNVALVGCGLGTNDSTRSFLTEMLLGKRLPPLILDADALNILSERRHWWEALPADTVITPHPGEMSRLCGLPTAEVNRRRWQIAPEFAQAWKLVIVLKGAHTLIAAPDGELAAIPFKTDALSTAGTGDVLAGVIAGLRAQGVSAFASACLGAYVHALAGMIAIDVVGSSRSVLAGDVLNGIGRAFAAIENS